MIYLKIDVQYAISVAMSLSFVDQLKKFNTIIEKSLPFFLFLFLVRERMNNIQTWFYYLKKTNDMKVNRFFFLSLSLSRLLAFIIPNNRKIYDRRSFFFSRMKNHIDLLSNMIELSISSARYSRSDRNHIHIYPRE